jgi:AraC-like DNA-binding protein
MNNRQTVFIPKQPFMVELADVYYTLKFGKLGISSFYFFKVGDDVSVIDTSIPDGCIDIIFHYKNNSEEIGADFYGTALLPHSMKCYKGCYHFGVRFLPGIVPAFTDLKMINIIDRIIPFEEVSKDKQLPYRIASLSGFENQIKLFIAEYCRFYNGSSGKLNQMIVAEIVNSYGMIRIDELSKKTGYSISYLEKIFNNDIGISPKKFCSIIRFQWLLSCINSMNDGNRKIDECMDCKGLAYNLGYFDQAHMIHEFKKYSSRTPSDYIHELNKVSYNTRLKIIKETI